MAVLLLHAKATFEDQTVYATGNAFEDCEFVRCTIVVKAFAYHFVGCKFDSCIWHIDVTIFDHDQLAAIRLLLDDLISKTLPNPPAVGQNTNVAAAPTTQPPGSNP